MADNLLWLSGTSRELQRAPYEEVRDFLNIVDVENLALSLWTGSTSLVTLGLNATAGGNGLWHTANLSFGTGLTLTNGVLTASGGAGGNVDVYRWSTALNPAAWSSFSATVSLSGSNIRFTNNASTGVGDAAIQLSVVTGRTYLIKGIVAAKSAGHTNDPVMHFGNALNTYGGYGFAYPMGADHRITATDTTLSIYVETGGTVLNEWDELSELSVIEENETPTAWGSLTGTLADQVDLWNSLESKLNLSGGALTGGLTIAGDIVPTADNVYSLGSPTMMWKDVYIGPGSLYLNGQKILEDTLSGTIVMRADAGQNISIQTYTTGDIELAPQGTGLIQLKGSVVFDANSIIRSSTGGNITFDDPVTFSAGTGIVGSLTVDGNAVWHVGNLNPKALDLAHTSITGVLGADHLGTGTRNGTKFLRDDGVWIAVTTGAASAWGSITGTLASQTDLQSALDGKASLTGATFSGNVSASVLYASGGSVYVDAPAGNLHYWMRDTVSGSAVSKGLLYWDRAGDWVRLRKYNAVGSSDLILQETALLWTGQTVWHSGNLPLTNLMLNRGELGTQDLNTVTEPGNYHQSATADAASALNYPTPIAGWLSVFNNAGSNNNMVWQRYQEYSSGDVYTRTFYSTSWSPWLAAWNSDNFNPSSKYDKTGGDLSGNMRVVKATTAEAQFELASGAAIARHFYRDTDFNYGMYLSGADGATKTRFRFDGTNMSVETPVLLINDATAYHSGNQLGIGTTSTAARSALGLGSSATTDYSDGNVVYTIARRNGSGDIHARLFRSEYQEETNMVGGAIAFRNSTSDNYIRFCNSNSAVRTWLGLSTADAVSFNRVACGFDQGVPNSISCSAWFRSNGNTGWFNYTYTVGVYATSTTYLRSYQDKPMYADDFVTPSDERLKTKIEDLIYKGRLRPVEYTLIKTGKRELGFVAQEVLKRYPLLVGQELDEASGEMRLNVSYTKAVPVLSAQLNNLEDTVEAMQKQIVELERKIKAHGKN